MVIDTNIIIDHLRTKQRTTSAFASLLGKRKLYISAVTVFELYQGAQTEAKQQDVQKILKGLVVLPFNEPVAELSAKLIRHLDSEKQSIGIADVFIAATALANRQPLRTENRKHFERIPHLKII